MDFRVKGREVWMNQQTEATAVGRWPLKCLVAFLEMWKAQRFVILFPQCLIIASFQRFTLALTASAVSAGAPQSPRSARGAVSSSRWLDAGEGRGHRFVLSNSGMQWDETYPTPISQAIHIYALMRGGGSGDANLLEWELLVQSYFSQKVLFYLSNALRWLVGVSLKLSHFSHTV